MTCRWQHTASESADTVRPCGMEGHPFCKEHQFIAEVLDETEAITLEICAQRETALTAWQAQVQRFSLLVTQADELTPSAFVKRIHEALPELWRTAMEAAIYTYVVNARKDDCR